MKLNRQQLRKIILKEMEDPTLPGMGGFSYGQHVKPDKNLIDAIMQRLDGFIREQVSALQAYNGKFRGLEIGHIKALIAATSTLKECERGNIDKDWASCADDVLGILKLISNIAKSNEIAGVNDTLTVGSGGGKGALIPLLQLSIQQANR